MDKEEQRAAASKGKAKSTQADETRDAEYRRQLEEHDLALDELLATREKHDQEAKTNVLDAGGAKPSHVEVSRENAAKSHLDTVDKDPYMNPFTGSYVFPETGGVSL